MTASESARVSLAAKSREQRPLSAAAAKSAVDSVSLLNEVLVSTGMLQSELAEVLGITEGRVSQVLNGDGNVRVSTLARFLKAMGRDLEIQAQDPVEQDFVDVEMDVLVKADYVSVKTVSCFTENGLRSSRVLEFSDSHPLFRADEKYVHVRALKTGETETDFPSVKREPSKHEFNFVASEVDSV